MQRVRAALGTATSPTARQHGGAWVPGGVPGVRGPDPGSPTPVARPRPGHHGPGLASCPRAVAARGDSTPGGPGRASRPSASLRVLSAPPALASPVPCFTYTCPLGRPAAPPGPNPAAPWSQRLGRGQSREVKALVQAPPRAALCSPQRSPGAEGALLQVPPGVRSGGLRPCCRGPPGPKPGMGILAADAVHAWGAGERQGGQGGGVGWGGGPSAVRGRWRLGGRGGDEPVSSSLGAAGPGAYNTSCCCCVASLTTCGTRGGGGC